LLTQKFAKGVASVSSLVQQRLWDSTGMSTVRDIIIHIWKIPKTVSDVQTVLQFVRTVVSQFTD
jgi:hypothetical protein